MNFSKIMLFVCMAVMLSVCACVEKGDVIATVGNEKITVESFSNRILATPPAYQAYINTEQGKKQFIELLVKEKLILESAKQAGVNKRQEYKESVSDFINEQKRQLKEYEDGIMMEMYLKDIQNSFITATESEIDKYYKEHKDDFEHPVAITAKHILLSSKEDAVVAMERLEKGESFDKVAKEMSTDKVSAERGGLIGPFRKGELVKEFEDAVFSLKKGEISEIVESPFGMHIITKVSEEKLPAIPEDLAKNDIKKIIEKNKFDNWLEETKKKYNLKIDYSKLKSVQGTDFVDTASVQSEQPDLDEFNG